MPCESRRQHRRGHGDGLNGEPLGTTVNAVTPPPLDPPPQLVFSDLGSATLHAIRGHSAFVVNARPARRDGFLLLSAARGSVFVPSVPPCTPGDQNPGGNDPESGHAGYKVRGRGWCYRLESGTGGSLHTVGHFAHEVTRIRGRKAPKMVAPCAKPSGVAGVTGSGRWAGQRGVLGIPGGTAPMASCCYQGGRGLPDKARRRAR